MKEEKKAVFWGFFFSELEKENTDKKKKKTRKKKFLKVNEKCRWINEKLMKENERK